MNGSELKKLQAYDDGEWRGYIAGKIESIAKSNEDGVKRLEVAVIAHAKGVSRVVESMNKLEVKLAKIPEKCIQVGNILKLSERVDDLEDDRVGRTAVSKALWGVSGVAGFIVTGLTILKLTGVI